MKMIDRVFLYIACICVAGFSLFSISHQQDVAPKAVRCVVERVVDDESDEPVMNEQWKRPYTVLSYQPAWTGFDVPGDLGEPGKYVNYVPPAVD